MTVALRLDVASKTKLRLFNLDFSCVANGDTEERDLPQDNSIKWYTFDFPTQPSITNDAWYWLAWWSENEITAWKDGASANTRCRDAQSYDGWPCPLTPDNYYTGLLSIYCTYTPSGGGLTIPVAMHHYLQQQQFVKSIKPLRFPKLGVKQL